MKKKSLLATAVLATVIAPQLGSVYNAEELSICDQVTASQGGTADCSQFDVELLNGSFEDYGLNWSGGGVNHIVADGEDGWQTTEPRGTIEVWNKTGYENNVSGGSVDEIDGEYLIELKGYSNGSIYQDFETEPGQKLTIHFQHGGRSREVERMNLMVGAPDEVMDDDSVLWPTLGDSDDILTTSEVAAGEWDKQTIEYIVPEGQTITRLAFSSPDITPTSGDLIDDVRVEAESIYDINNSLEYIDTTGSIDMYLGTTEITRISQGTIGKFRLVVNVEQLYGFTDLIFVDENGEEIPMDYTYGNGEIIITGDDIGDKAILEFIAYSSLDAPEEIHYDSTLKYLSELQLELGQTNLDGNGAQVRDIEYFVAH